MNCNELNEHRMSFNDSEVIRTCDLVKLRAYPAFTSLIYVFIAYICIDKGEHVTWMIMEISINAIFMQEWIHSQGVK